jgi:hypothetical protein
VNFQFALPISADFLIPIGIAQRIYIPFAICKKFPNFIAIPGELALPGEFPSLIDNG